jgi:micrococcal nuclease
MALGAEETAIAPRSIKTVGRGCDAAGVRYVALQFVGMLSTACGQSPPPAQSSLYEGVRVEVVRVIDGDTLVAKVAGRDLRVRLIGVDAPEIDHPRSVVPGECFGAAAAGALRRLAPRGSVLKITPDRERRDLYGRKLFYAWTPEGTFINAALIHDGYARAMVVPPNDRFIELFRAAETAAHQAHLGLWSECPR